MALKSCACCMTSSSAWQGATVGGWVRACVGGWVVRAYVIACVCLCVPFAPFTINKCIAAQSVELRGCAQEAKTKKIMPCRW